MQRAFIATVAACLVMTAAAAVAQDNPIEQRQQIMKHIGKAVGAGAKMAKGELPFDEKTAAEVFTTIKSEFPGFTDLFPDGTQTGNDTEAKATIWSDRDGFEKAADEMLQVASKYAANPPTTLDTFRPALGELGKKCGGCHETYRVKKD